MKRNHPALKGVRQEELFGWNQHDFSVYHNYITPVSQAAITTGANTAVWGASRFGMTTAHLKLGSGDIILSQTDLTETFEKDSGAAWFARQILSTVLDDGTRANAAEFIALPPLKAKPLAKKDALEISLKEVANMAFADDVDNDGKGGWTDQGSSNDLSLFPVGEVFFGGVPFDIANPGPQNAPSCVVVADVKGRKLTAESKPIRVDAKLKRLLFLHSAAWMPETMDAEVGEYVISYESGRKLSIPLRAGENIRDWWSAPSQKISQADCVWSAMNKSGIVGVYLYEWKNPYPDDAIHEVVLKAQKVVIGLAGLTGEKVQ